MSWLLDTQLLLWMAIRPEKLSAAARRILKTPDAQVAFSAVSLWEIIIKRSIGRADFDVDARRLRRGLLDNDYRELAVLSEHVLAVERLPALHKDPFDRLLIAQADAEGLTLLTSDEVVASYPGSAIKRV